MLVATVEAAVGIHQCLDVLRVETAEVEGVQIEAGNERPSFEVSVARLIPEIEPDGVGEVDVESTLTSPVGVLGPGGHLLIEPLEESVDPERHQRTGEHLRG